jgi:hypothetical protein
MEYAWVLIVDSTLQYINYFPHPEQKCAVLAILNLHRLTYHVLLFGFHTLPLECPV